MNWLKSIAKFFKALFSPETAAAIQKGIETAAPYIKQALEVVKVIAALTPTRADDEILALLEKYGLPAILEPGANRAEILRQVALAELQKKYPGISDRTLNRAIEIALGAVKP